MDTNGVRGMGWVRSTEIVGEGTENSEGKISSILSGLSQVRVDGSGVTTPHTQVGDGCNFATPGADILIFNCSEPNILTVESCNVNQLRFQRICRKDIH